MTTVPCKLCGKPTKYTGTQLCNPCWEINRHIDGNPEPMIIYKSLYINSPQREAFESREGIMCRAWTTPITNYQVLQVITTAFLLDLPVEYTRASHETWKSCKHFPTDFHGFRFRLDKKDATPLACD